MQVRPHKTQSAGISEWEAFYKEALQQEFELAAAVHGIKLPAGDVLAHGRHSNAPRADTCVRPPIRAHAISVPGPLSTSSEGSSWQNVVQPKPRPSPSPYTQTPPTTKHTGTHAWPRSVQHGAGTWHDNAAYAAEEPWQGGSRAPCISPTRPRRRSLGFDSYFGLHQSRQQPPQHDQPPSGQPGTGYHERTFQEHRGAAYMGHHANSWGPHSTAQDGSGLDPSELIDACMDEMEELCAAMHSRTAASSQAVSHTSFPEHPIRQADAVELLHKGLSPGRVRLFGPGAAFQVPSARARSPSRAADTAWATSTQVPVLPAAGSPNGWRKNRAFNTSRPHSPPPPPGYGSPQEREWLQRAQMQQQPEQPLPQQQSHDHQEPGAPLARPSSPGKRRDVEQAPVTGSGLLEYGEEGEGLFFSPQAYRQFSIAPARAQPAPGQLTSQDVSGHATGAIDSSGTQAAAHAAADVWLSYDQQQGVMGGSQLRGGKAASVPAKQGDARTRGSQQPATSHTSARRALGYSQELWETPAGYQEQRGPQHSSFSVFDVPRQMQQMDGAHDQEAVHARQQPHPVTLLPQRAGQGSNSGSGGTGHYGAVARPPLQGPEDLLATIDAIRHQSLSGSSRGASAAHDGISQQQAWSQPTAPARDNLPAAQMQAIAVAAMSGRGSPSGRAAGAPAVPDLSALTEQLAKMDTMGLDAVRGYASGFIDGRCAEHPEEFVHVRPHVVKDAVLRLVEAAMAAKAAQASATPPTNTAAAAPTASSHPRPVQAVATAVGPAAAMPPSLRLATPSPAADSTTTNYSSQLASQHTPVSIPTSTAQAVSSSTSIVQAQPQSPAALLQDMALNLWGHSKTPASCDPMPLLSVGSPAAPSDPAVELSFAVQCASGGSSPDHKLGQASSQQAMNAHGWGSHSQLTDSAIIQTPLEALASQLRASGAQAGMYVEAQPATTSPSQVQHRFSQASSVDTGDEKDMLLEQVVERRLSSDWDEQPLVGAIKPSASTSSLSEQLQKLLLEPASCHGVAAAPTRSSSSSAGGAVPLASDGGNSSSSQAYHMGSGNASGVTSRPVSSEQLVLKVLSESSGHGGSAPDASATAAAVIPVPEPGSGPMLQQGAPQPRTTRSSRSTSSAGGGAVLDLVPAALPAALPMSSSAQVPVVQPLAVPEAHARSAGELVLAAEGLRESLWVQQAVAARAAAAEAGKATASAAAAAATTADDDAAGSAPHSPAVSQAATYETSCPSSPVSMSRPASVRKSVSIGRLQPPSFKRGSASSIDSNGHPGGHTTAMEGVVPGGFGSPTHPGSPHDSPRPSFTGGRRASSGSQGSVSKRQHAAARQAHHVPSASHHDGDGKPCVRPTNLSRSSLNMDHRSGSSSVPPARVARANSSSAADLPAPVSQQTGQEAATPADYLQQLQAMLHEAEQKLAPHNPVSSASASSEVPGPLAQLDADAVQLGTAAAQGPSLHGAAVAVQADSAPEMQSGSLVPAAPAREAVPMHAVLAAPALARVSLSELVPPTSVPQPVHVVEEQQQQGVSQPEPSMPAAQEEQKQEGRDALSVAMVSQQQQQQVAQEPGLLDGQRHVQQQGQQPDPPSPLPSQQQQQAGGQNQELGERAPNCADEAQLQPAEAESPAAPEPAAVAPAALTAQPTGTKVETVEYQAAAEALKSGSTAEAVSGARAAARAAASRSNSNARGERREGSPVKSWLAAAVAAAVVNAPATAASEDGGNWAAASQPQVTGHEAPDGSSATVPSQQEASVASELAPLVTTQQQPSDDKPSLRSAGSTQEVAGPAAAAAAAAADVDADPAAGTNSKQPGDAGFDAAAAPAKPVAASVPVQSSSSMLSSDNNTTSMALAAPVQATDQPAPSLTALPPAHTMACTVTAADTAVAAAAFSVAPPGPAATAPACTGEPHSMSRQASTTGSTVPTLPQSDPQGLASATVAAAQPTALVSTPAVAAAPAPAAPEPDAPATAAAAATSPAPGLDAVANANSSNDSLTPSEPAAATAPAAAVAHQATPASRSQNGPISAEGHASSAQPAPAPHPASSVADAAGKRTPSPHRGAGKDLKAIEPVLAEIREIKASIPPAAVAGFVAAAASNSPPPEEVAAAITPDKLRRLSALLAQLADFAAGLEAKRGDRDSVVTKLYVLHRDLSRWAAPILQPLGIVTGAGVQPGVAAAASGTAAVTPRPATATPSRSSSSAGNAVAGAANSNTSQAGSSSAGSVPADGGSALATPVVVRSSGSQLEHSPSSQHSSPSLMSSHASEASLSGIPSAGVSAAERATSPTGSDARSSTPSSPVTSPASQRISSSPAADQTVSSSGSGAGRTVDKDPSFSFPASPVAANPPCAAAPQGPTARKEAATAAAAVTDVGGLAVTLPPPVAPKPQAGTANGVDPGSKGDGAAAAPGAPPQPQAGRTADPEVQVAIPNSSLMAHQAAAMAAVSSRLGIDARLSQSSSPRISQASSGAASPARGSQSPATSNVQLPRYGPQMSAHSHNMGAGTMQPQGMTMGMGMGTGMLAPFIAGGGVNSQLAGPNAFEAMMAASAQQQQQQQLGKVCSSNGASSPRPSAASQQSSGSEKHDKRKNHDKGSFSFKDKLGSIFRK